ncbi:hypothetical protein COL922a_007833 [Colletotrichum nupharicola]|nr:hypothetical protein COL922a_007833 [Colletotrichum nupharicola]
MPSETQSVELHVVAQDAAITAEDTSAHSLPPADKGPLPWKFLFGSFIVEAVLWGFPLSYGVFQDYYTKHPSFQQDSNIAVIGTVATSVYSLGGPIATPLVARFQAWQRHMIVVGWLGCCVSLAAASFMSSVPGLIATQGVLYGFAFTLLYYPVLRMLNEWFVHRRGFAFVIMSTGAGCSGVGLPFLLEWLLAKYSYQTTLRAMAVVQFVTILPVIPLLKGRLPVSRQGMLRKDDFGFASRLSTYWKLWDTTSHPFTCQPANNLAMIFGQLALGYVSDRVKNVLTLVFVSSFSAAVASFTIWGYGSSLASLLVFSIIFGLATGGFPCLWQRFGPVLSDDPGPVYALMAFGKGLGNILIGPISAALMAGRVNKGEFGHFQPLIIFLGSTMLCSSLGALVWPPCRRGDGR